MKVNVLSRISTVAGKEEERIHKIKVFVSVEFLDHIGGQYEDVVRDVFFKFSKDLDWDKVLDSVLHYRPDLISKVVKYNIESPVLKKYGLDKKKLKSAFNPMDSMFPNIISSFAIIDGVEYYAFKENGKWMAAYKPNGRFITIKKNLSGLEEAVKECFKFFLGVMYEYEYSVKDVKKIIKGISYLEDDKRKDYLKKLVDEELKRLNSFKDSEEFEPKWS